VQNVHEQVCETIEASKQLMGSNPQHLDDLAAQVRRVALATKKLEEADPSGSSRAASFKKWMGL
jgi:hypothetical protein